MHIVIGNDEIHRAVAALITETIPNSTVVEIRFVREKGGNVHADATIELR